MFNLIVSALSKILWVWNSRRRPYRFDLFQDSVQVYTGGGQRASGYACLRGWKT